MKTLPPFTGDQELDYFLSEVHDILSARYSISQETVENEVSDVIDYVDEEIEKVYERLPIFTISKRFDFGDASPKPIVEFAEPVLIRLINITLIIPFNAPSSLQVGVAGDPSLLMNEEDTDTQEETIFQTTPGLEVPIGTEVLLSISPGASSAGSGYVFIEYTPQVA